MNITRKNFLIGSMAVAAMGARQAFAVPPGTVRGKVRLKFGVVSDTHLDGNTRAWFRTALDWYRKQNIDALIIAGDMSNYGFFDELMYTAKEWARAFPNGKGPDGRNVTKLFCTGNHCVWPLADWHKKRYSDPAELKKNVVVLDPKGAWDRAFKEDYAPVFSKSVNGFQFVGSHWFWDKKDDGREAWFAANAKKIDPSQPFFYFQHAHPKDTCYGDKAWGHDDGTSTRLLSALPNAIAFSGHSHFSLTDERSVWQGAFTSIGTASLNYTGICDRCNAASGADDHKGRQGMLVTVCDDHVCIARREFVWNASLGDDWIIPVGKGAAKPYEYAKRTAVRVAPEFPKGAVAKAVLVEPKPGKDGVTPPPSQVKVSHPAAEPRKGCRALTYEVDALARVEGAVKVLKTWRVCATDYHLPPSNAGGECSCIVRLKELPKNEKIRFVVRPVECFGKRGKPIKSAVFTTPA